MNLLLSDVITFFRKLRFYLVFLLAILGYKANAQVTCTGGVPTYNIDFLGNPNGIWTSPALTRQGNCCGTSSPDRCLRFDITLDSLTAAVNFEIASGAVPPGALFYQIDCGAPQQVGQYICLSGTGVRTLTFCKPGNNTNTYRVTSIPRPIFPKDDTIRVGCTKSLTVLGVVPSSVTFTSIFPGTAGQYNTYLSCTSGCTTTNVTPTTGAPAFVDYRICGYPTADQCGLNATVCDTVRVYMYPQLTVSVSPNPGSFCPTSTGVTLTSTTSGGLSPYTYNWTRSAVNIGTGSSVFANAAGTYILTVNDLLSASCSSTVVNVPVNVANVVPVIASSTNVNCNGGNNGSATVSVTGGATPYTYSWSNGPTTAVNNNLIAGTYIATVTDAGGCTATVSATITQPAILNPILLSQVNVGCNGESTGAADIGVSGGTGPYGYSWTNGFTTQDLEAVPAGTYTLTVTDSKGCTANLSVTITQPGALVPLISGVVFTTTNVSCKGGSDGSVTVNVSGGTMPYFYNWSSGGTNPTENSLPAGPIAVLITDGNGCSATANTVLTEPDSLKGTIDALSLYFGGYNVSCNGSTDGTIDMSVFGGTSPYTYAWSNGDNTEDIIGLGAGPYQVIITDNNGCMDTVNTALTEPAVLVVTLTSPLTPNGTNIGCKGENSGRIFSSVTGGTSPYSYSWLSGQTTPNLNSLYVGYYELLVGDQNGCTAMDTITLTEPDTLVPLITVTTVTGGFNISCNGGNDANATVLVSGGSAPYTYIWSTGDTTVTIDSLYAGEIYVNVFDVNYCTGTDTATIVEPDPILSQTSMTLEVTCYGGSDGEGFVSVLGGTPPYTYAWSNGDATDNPGGLDAGIYYVTITDANNCVKLDSIEIAQPDSLGLELQPSTFASGNNISCNGGDNGYIDLIVSGGTGPYTYTWSTTETNEDISNLPAGSYSVVVVDANGCTKSASITLTEPPVLIIDSISSPTYVGGWNISCNGGDNGSVYSGASGGAAPFVYYWSNGDSTQNISNVSVTTYILTVTDLNGCIVQDSILLTEPTLLSTSVGAQVNVSCNGGSDASVTISASGSTPPYQYTIDGSTYQSSPTFSGLAAGSYNITVQDTNGCSMIQGVTIIEPVAPVTAAATSVIDASCNGSANGSAVVSASGGTSPYLFSIDNTIFTTDSTFIGLAAGSYTFYINDANGCSTTATATVNEPVVLSGVLTPVDETCNSANGSATVAPSGGTSPYTYLWSTTDTTQTITNLIPGSYSVTVTDFQGCTFSSSVTVGSIANLNVSVGSQINNLCFGNTMGSATATLVGGTSPFTYVWSNGDSTATTSNLAAGTYTVQVTDANNCMGNSSVTILEPPVLTASVNSQINVTCFGASTGSVTVAGNGGVPAYQFSLDNVTFQTSGTFGGLSATNYTVYVQDANGCTTTQAVTIVEPSTALSASATAETILCNGLSVNVVVVASGGTAPYNGTGSFSVTQGSYSYTVSDANGCQSTVSVTVTEPSVLTSSASVTSVVTCNGANATVDITANGGTPSYTGTGSFTVGAGSYTYTVTDANNCASSVSIVVTEPSAVQISVTAPAITCSGQTTTVTVSASGGVAPYTGETTVVVSDGTFTYTVSDANGCASTSSITLVQPAAITTNAGVDQTECSVEFSLNAQLLNGQSGIWSALNTPAVFTQNTSPTSGVRNLNEGDNLLVWMVTDNSTGCIATDTLNVHQHGDDECELELPTGFSPNGDGFNDGYYIKGIDRYPDNEVIVFNRWGNEVYRKSNYKNSDWVGQNNGGEDLPEGTYFLILDVKSPKVIRKNTYVDLRRYNGR